jgi:hypothetical protein
LTEASSKCFVGCGPFLATSLPVRIGGSGAAGVGKAQRLSTWAEMNSAFNRDRGEVQNIKRVNHLTSRIEYRGSQEKKRKIVKESVSLHDIACYLSAYEIPDSLIVKFEALIVRLFANDLLKRQDGESLAYLSLLSGERTLLTASSTRC